MSKLILIVVLFFLSCKQDSVTITYVEDGDTFVTSTGEKIRLAEVDAPEVAHRNIPAQMYGEEAKQFAITTLLGKTVGLVRNGEKTYNRNVAVVYTSDGSNFAELLIKNGLAHTTPWTRSNILIDEYIKAKKDGVGLFKYPYEYPYVFRRTHGIR